MIFEVDTALRTLIERETGMRDVEVVFDAPTREWAGRRTAPTVDVYLYDIREDLRRRERGVINDYNEDETRIVGRHLPPRHLKLSYLVTAWTQRPEDEHRLLSALLGAFLRFEALPTDLLSGPLADVGLPVPLTVGLPPPEDRGFADVWSALGGELKPSIDVVVIAPVNTGQQFPMGPPVLTLPRFDFGGSGGFPGEESVELSIQLDAAKPPGKAKRGEKAPADAEPEELREAMTKAGRPAQRIGGPTPDGARVSMSRKRTTITRTP